MSTLELTTGRACELLGALEARYDRTATTVGIVHIGVGAFHRAHFAEYVDDVLASGEAGWAICGVGLLPEDRTMIETLRSQGGLYTRTIKSADGNWEPRLIGAITEALLAVDDPAAVMERLCDPRVRIVSLTITEGGYMVDEKTGEFDASAASVQSDLRGEQPPTTAFGYLVTALAARKRAGHPPFTVLSCDNLPGNGDAVRKGVLAVAAARDPELATWIRVRVPFPNSMVDRITPGTTQADKDRLEAEFGVIDHAAVVCEPFRQWVVQDSFSSGRPAFGEYGAQFASDVGPFESAKLRLLNGGHQALAHVGFLTGHDYIHEACTDPVVLNFLLGYMAEVQPTLERNADLDLERYARQLVARFSNPEINDHLDRIRSFASDRIPKWVVPAIQDNLAAGRSTTFGAVVIGAWRQTLLASKIGHGRGLVPDRRREGLIRLANDERGPLAFLDDRQLFGDLADRDRFTETYQQIASQMEESGVRRVVLQAVQQDLFRVAPADTQAIPA